MFRNTVKLRYDDYSLYLSGFLEYGNECSFQKINPCPECLFNFCDFALLLRTVGYKWWHVLSCVMKVEKWNVQPENMTNVQH